MKSTMAQHFLPLLGVLMLSGCSSLFPTEPGPTLRHFEAEAPAVGKPAPDIMVSTPDGQPTALSSLFGERPVVLQLGSYSCPVFRYRRFDMQPLRERYQDQVTFAVLYTTEAHPVGSASPYADREWVPWHNRLARVRTREATTLEGRIKQARFAKAQMHSNAQFLIDPLNNTGWRAYGRAPSAAFLIDAEGIVRLRQVWVEPKALRRAIEHLLNGAP